MEERWRRMRCKTYRICENGDCKRGQTMYKVLIVDDEKYICTLVANLVDWQSMNLEVSGMAHSAEEALRIAKETPPDIVISDVSMPDITGLELLKQLKDIHSRISAVFISGYSDFTFVQQALKLDAVDYLLKPIKKADLCNALKKVIAEKDTETIHNNQFEELANQAGSFRDHMQNQFVYEALYDNAALLSLTMAEISKKYYLDSEGSDFLIVMVKPDFDIVSA